MAINQKLLIPDSAEPNFKTVLYTGNGGTQSISGVGFQPDLVWVKQRTATANHLLFDSIRGVHKQLNSNQNYAETDRTSVDKGLDSFDSDGFTVKDTSAGDYEINGTNGGTYSGNGTYVAWCFNAGGNEVTNTDGTINTTVRANNDLGFSIATYTGVGYPNSTTAEIGHGLDSAPELVIIKGYGGTGQSGGAGSWAVGSSLLGSGWDGQIYLNSTYFYHSPNYFWNGAATSSVIKLKNDWFVNGANNNYVAYSFVSKAGVSKIGTYSGNSSTQTIVTGFQPSFVMIKTINIVSNWIIFDNERVNEYLMPSSNSQGFTATDMVTGFVSNGFTLGSDSTSAVNSSSANYVYMAFK